MFESCHSHYQFRSHISLPLLEAGQDRMRRSLLHITVCKSHVSVDMNAKRLSHYIGRQWRLTGAVLRRGWDPQERPFAPEHEQNEINRRRKADRQSAGRGWKGKKQL